MKKVRSSAGRGPGGYLRLAGFVTPAEVERFLGLLNSHSALFSLVRSKGGLGPSYLIMGGEQIREHLPELAELGQERVRPIAEKFAGRPLQEMASPRRSLRVQLYRQREHGFRWHADGSSYAAILTLENSNRGATQFISPLLSSVLLLLRYPLYPWPALFSLFPHQSVTPEPGDLLVFPGSRLLHRGVTLEEQGQRVIVVYGYDELGRRVNPLKDRLARWLNY